MTTSRSTPNLPDQPEPESPQVSDLRPDEDKLGDLAGWLQEEIEKLIPQMEQLASSGVTVFFCATTHDPLTNRSITSYARRGHVAAQLGALSQMTDMLRFDYPEREDCFESGDDDDDQGDQGNSETPK